MILFSLLFFPTFILCLAPLRTQIRRRPACLVHKEDHEICERLQEGRSSPASNNGGLLSPYWEKGVQKFQKLIVENSMKYSKSTNQTFYRTTQRLLIEKRPLKCTKQANLVFWREAVTWTRLQAALSLGAGVKSAGYYPLQIRMRNVPISKCRTNLRKLSTD